MFSNEIKIEKTTPMPPKNDVSDDQTKLKFNPKTRRILGRRPVDQDNIIIPDEVMSKASVIDINDAVDQPIQPQEIKNPAKMRKSKVETRIKDVDAKETMQHQMQDEAIQQDKNMNGATHANDDMNAIKKKKIRKPFGKRFKEKLLAIDVIKMQDKKEKAMKDDMVKDDMTTVNSVSTPEDTMIDNVFDFESLKSSQEESPGNDFNLNHSFMHTISFLNQSIFIF